MAKLEKQFDTGLRILEILKILLKDNITKANLIEKLSCVSDVEQVYTLEAFIKYFNTIEIAGFKLNREKNIYKLENAFKYLKLTEEEKELLLKVLSKRGLLYDEKQEETVKQVSYRFLKYFNNDIKEETLEKIFNPNKMSSSDEETQNILSTLNKLKNDKLMVKIQYESKTNKNNEIVVEIRKIKDENGKISLVCYIPEKRRNKKIYLDSIVQLSQLPTKTSESISYNTIVFEVYGRLAYLYKLKDSEKVINFSSNHLVISNSQEDKDVLLRRLLKYGENCKIIKPIEVQEEFISLTNEILKNLKEQ